MKYFSILMIFFTIVSNEMMSDQRSFVWTYEYMIMDSGKAEFEQYTTYSTPDWDNFEGNVTSELNFELEVGMSRYFDFAVYQNFKQYPGGTFKYEGFKLRTRIKIGKSGQYFLNPLIYLEYKGKPDFRKHEIETKLILARHIGNFNLAFNPYIELEYEEKWEFKPKYTLGINYRFGRLFSFGLEGKGDKDGHYIGPTISHGVEGLWFALGVLKNIGKVKEGKPEFSIRLILGVQL